MFAFPFRFIRFTLPFLAVTDLFFSRCVFLPMVSSRLFRFVQSFHFTDIFLRVFFVCFILFVFRFNTALWNLHSVLLCSGESIQTDMILRKLTCLAAHTRQRWRGAVWCCAASNFIDAVILHCCWQTPFGWPYLYPNPTTTDPVSLAQTRHGSASHTHTMMPMISPRPSVRTKLSLNARCALGGAVPERSGGGGGGALGNRCTAWGHSRYSRRRCGDGLEGPKGWQRMPEDGGLMSVENAGPHRAPHRAQPRPPAYPTDA